MAGDFNLLARNILEWSTDKPYCDRPRESPVFSILGSRFYLKLERNNYNYDSRKYSLLSLCNMDSEKNNLPADAMVRVFLTCLSGHKYYTLSDYCRFGKSSQQRFFIYHNVYEDSENGHWIIYCIFSNDLLIEQHINGNEKMCLSTLPGLEGQPSSTPDSIIMKAKLAASAPDDSPCTLKNLSFDLSRLLEQKSFSDVTLKCGDRTFSAHRNILAARSEVFSAMFQNQMIESQTGSIDIKDIDGDVLDLLLKYLYSGKISDLTVGVATKLYLAADKYSVSSLKKVCSKVMLGSLTKENCLDFLLLADACSDNNFKDRLINFVAEILTLLDEAWLKFTEKNPQMAIIVYQRYALITKKA